MEKKQFMSFRLDDNVVIALLAVCVLASMAFVIRYKNYKPCTDFKINSKGTNFSAGTIIRFETDVKDFKRLYWDFGDNQKSVTEVGSSIHSYDQPGNYVITLIVDGKCTEYKTISVINAPEVVDSTLVPKVVMPETAEVDVPSIFRDTSIRANSWEWRFGETAVVDAVGRNPTYTYRTPGWKTISLVINGNIKSPLVRKIFVNAKPEARPPVTPSAPRPSVRQRPETDPLPEQLNPAPPAAQTPTPTPIAPTVVKYPELAVGDFNQMIRSSTGGGKGIASFSKYFCNGNLNTPTTLNGKATTFRQFFDKVARLKKADKLPILETTLIKDQQTNCVTSIQVVAKVKSGVLGWSLREL